VVEAASRRTIIRIELWHVLLLAALSAVAVLVPMELIDAASTVMGGLFMAINFLLLSFGVAWVLTPLGSKGRIKAGIGLLVLKLVIFLGVLTTLFFRFSIDALSFSLGFSTLLLAVLFEAMRNGIALRT
jgi:hypothetical protein